MPKKPVKSYRAKNKESVKKQTQAQRFAAQNGFERQDSLNTIINQINGVTHAKSPPKTNVQKTKATSKSKPKNFKKKNPPKSKVAASSNVQSLIAKCAQRDQDAPSTSKPKSRYGAQQKHKANRVPPPQPSSFRKKDPGSPGRSKAKKKKNTFGMVLQPQKAKKSHTNVNNIKAMFEKRRENGA